MTTALIYVRQSRNKAYERTVSPDLQREACAQLKAVMACGMVEVFTDLDVSGGKRARRGYDAMLARISAGGVAVVAAYDQSRAFRSSQLAIEFRALLNEPAHRGIEVVFVHGTFDRSAVGGFSYTVLAAAHQMEREITGEKMRDAKRHQAKLGAMVGAVPAGYLRAKDGAVTVDEPVAAIIRRVFDEYATGRYSARDMARRLNSEGSIPPRFKGGWRADTITQFLANDAYIAKTYVSRRHREGPQIAALWPALIEPEVWRAVQRRLGPNQGRGGRKTRAYAFQGLLRCACGAKLHGHFFRGVRYYLCRHTDQVLPCSAPGIREDDLLPQGRAIFAALDALKPSDFHDQIGRSESRHVQPVNALAQVDATIERLGKRFEWGHLDEAAYQAEWQRLNERRHELLAAQEVKPRAGLRLAGLLDAWDRADHIGRRELLASLFEELHVHAGRIESFTPRQDRAAEIVTLMELVSASSPGGVRTRDLSLERAAS
jgi:DNA invertase Pin-like site-specific DNA recombinase